MPPMAEKATPSSPGTTGRRQRPLQQSGMEQTRKWELCPPVHLVIARLSVESRPVHSLLRPRPAAFASPFFEALRSYHPALTPSPLRLSYPWNPDYAMAAYLERPSPPNRHKTPSPSSILTFNFTYMVESFRIRAFCDSVARQFRPRKIILFGSHAYAIKLLAVGHFL